MLIFHFLINISLTFQIVKNVICWTKLFEILHNKKASFLVQKYDREFVQSSCLHKFI